MPLVTLLISNAVICNRVTTYTTNQTKHIHALSLKKEHENGGAHTDDSLLNITVF